MIANKEMLSLQNDRYKVFILAKEWLHVFLKADEAKNMSQSEIVRTVLEDILSGKVTEKDIEKSRKEKPKGTSEAKKEEKTN